MANVTAPEVIGPYRVLGILGQGGMGTVYLALHRGVGGFEKQVALKCIAPHVAGDEDFIRMLVDEARLMVQLTHPNLVQVLDLAAYDGVHVLVLEYVAGVDLRSLAAGAPLSLAEAAAVGAGAARGLAYAHRKGVVHRDVSGHNLLVSVEGAVKVLDFGIAKAASNRQRTEIGVLKGKLPYMSPEQAAGKPLDGRSDLFSLAVVLWELGTNQRLFTGDTEMQVLLKVQRCEVERPSKLVPGFPRELEEILVRALQSDPAARFATGDELADALEAFARGHRGAVDPRTSLGERVAALLAERRTPSLDPAPTGTATSAGGYTVADGTVAAAPASPAPRSRRKAAWALSAVAVVILAGLGVVFRTRSSQPAEQSPAAKEPPAARAAVVPSPPGVPGGGSQGGGTGRSVVGPISTSNTKVVGPISPSAKRPPKRPPPPLAAPAEPEAEAARPAAGATLSLNANPWARVYLDGKAVAESTPLLNYTVAPGKHHLVLVNPEARLRKELDVEVAAGAHERLTITWP